MEKFSKVAKRRLDLILGSGQMIPGFEAGIVGMKKGKKDVKVTLRNTKKLTERGCFQNQSE